MEKFQLKRIFRFNKKELSDIDTKMSPNEILEHYSNIYPELVNGSITQGDIKEDKIYYEISTNIGTKG